MHLLSSINWIGSKDYYSKIATALTKIVILCENAATEAETSSIFEREIYYLIRKELGIELQFKKENPVNGVIHHFQQDASATTRRGRTDAIVNNLIIEYKHHSKLTTVREFSSAIAQVEGYINTLLSESGEKYDAILTDGIKIAYFSFSGNAICHTSLRNLRTDDLDRIVRAMLNNKAKKFDPSNISKDFAVSARHNSPSKQIATILFEQLTSRITDKSYMLYTEWKELLHLSIEDNGKSRDIEKRRIDLSDIFARDINTPEKEYKALFALQTTYSIIIKLIACKIIDKLDNGTETYRYLDLSTMSSDKMCTFFQRMEEGYSYNNNGIRNLLEGDFFSWYADSAQWSEQFWISIREVICLIDDYTTFSIKVRYEPADIFKDLYMSIIPQSIRHSMGEYFTPEWLADCVITEALHKDIRHLQWTALDPCCGSGIFLITLIKKLVGDVCITELTSQEKNKILTSILSRVQGIDINPLSVLSARLSYYIALLPFGNISDIEIPVYLGDSAIIPRSIYIDGIKCYTHTIHNTIGRPLQITLPARLVKRNDFETIMNDIKATVLAENASLIFDLLCSHLTAKEKQSKRLINSIQTLSEELVFLQHNKWDGIWVRVATNFMLIARLGRFDLITGNPPWVKWEHLPAEYTRRIKEFCDIRHIFCNDGGLYGGAQLNICALIANVAATNWLKENGTLAFLMPDSLMSQNSYEEYRNFYTDYTSGKRLFLQKIDRWCAPLRPFKVGKRTVSQDFNTYYYARKHQDYRNGIHVRLFSKKKDVRDDTINACRTYTEALHFLEISYGRAKQLSPDSTAFTYSSEEHDFSSIIGPTAYTYRTGVESTPFEIFKLLGEGPSNRPGNYRFKNKVLKTSRYKVEDIPTNGWDFPTQLIYPMVEGPAISPFSFDCGNNFHIIPYSSGDTSRPISLNELLKKNKELALYFLAHKQLLDKQSKKSKAMHRGDEFYALSKIGKYTFAPCIVAVRDNSRFCASVVHPVKTPWGEMKQAICVKHTIIISQDTQGSFITKDEAHYICGILNCDIVKSYIHATFKTNGFSLNKAHLYLPRYKADDPLHRRLSLLARYAALVENADKRERIAHLLSMLYLRLCKNRPTSFELSTPHKQGLLFEDDVPRGLHTTFTQKNGGKGRF